MSTVANQTKYTPEDLLAMPDGNRYELVNGDLVERDMGFQSSRIGGRIYGRAIRRPRASSSKNRPSRPRRNDFNPSSSETAHGFLRAFDEVRSH